MTDVRVPVAFPSTEAVADKRVVVTGSGRGLGVLIATAFHRRGARVALVGRDSDNLATVAAELGRANTLVVPADVTTPEGNDHIVDTVVDTWGGLDVWIANAGVSPVVAPVARLGEESWHQIVATNLTGVFLGARAALRVLPHGGRIIVTTSVLAQRPRAGLSAYSASKAGAEALVKSLAVEVAGAGITVNAVSPGWFDSPLTEPWQQRPDLEASVLGHVPLGRWGRSEELVGAYLFLASPAASYITGTVLDVDGGYRCL